MVGVLVGISLAGGGDDVGPSSIEDVDAVQREFAGVPAAGNTIGDPDAPVEIVEYGDIVVPGLQGGLARRRSPR